MPQTTSVSSGASRQTFLPIRLMKTLNVHSFVYGAELVGYNMFHLLHTTDLQKRYTSLVECAFIFN
jgi:hypothetical protein